jgi:hypothetical protein
VPTIGLRSDQVSDQIPASHRDLVQCPPVAAPPRSCPTATRRPRSCGATSTASACGSTPSQAPRPMALPRPPGSPIALSAMVDRVPCRRPRHCVCALIRAELFERIPLPLTLPSDLGKTPLRTALSPRYLIRMRALVQVQPGPRHRVDLRQRSPVVSFNGGCFREGLRTAVLERIPGLLSSDDYGSSVERRPERQVSWQVLRPQVMVAS